MRMIIEIPTEFEGHFCRDRFLDSIQRLRADAHCLAGNYEKELADMLAEAFKKAEVIETEMPTGQKEE